MGGEPSYVESEILFVSYFFFWHGKFIESQIEKACAVKKKMRPYAYTMSNYAEELQKLTYF